MMLDNAVESAVGNAFVLAAAATILLLVLGSSILKHNAFPQVPRYEVSKDGKKQNQFSTLSGTLREAYPKVTALRSVLISKLT